MARQDEAGAAVRVQEGQGLAMEVDGVDFI